MGNPEWSPRNLDTHYKKRLEKDDICWQEILKITHSMTKGEYEKESYNAFQDGAIEYEAEYERYDPARYRVDKRTVLTVFSLNRRKMITCYHKHYHGVHLPGSAAPSIENLIEFIDDLDAEVDANIEKLFKIEPIKKNLSKNQLRKYIAPKLKKLKRKI